VDPRVAPPPPGTNRDPVTGHYRRTTSGLHQSEPTNFPSTTSRIRRQTGTTPPQASTQIPPLPSSGEEVSLTPLGQQALPETRNITSGFRRSLTGSVPGTGRTAGTGTGPTPKPPTTTSTAAPQTCTVACAHCQGLFQVLLKPTAYTVLCVHCGQLNRIDPLPG
jgi:hypothetical protein